MASYSQRVDNRVLDTGDEMSGDLTFANAKGVKGKDSGGTAAVLAKTSGNGPVFGDPAFSTGPQMRSPSATGFVRTTGGVDHTVWDAGNDGAGSGLDADTLDGVQGSSFARGGASGSYTGDGAGGGQAIAVAFRPRLVIIQGSGPRFIMVADPHATDVERGIEMAAVASLLSSATVDITATGFTVKGNANVNLETYTWCAYG